MVSPQIVLTTRKGMHRTFSALGARTTLLRTRNVSRRTRLHEKNRKKRTRVSVKSVARHCGSRQGNRPAFLHQKERGCRWWRNKRQCPLRTTKKKKRLKNALNITHQPQQKYIIHHPKISTRKMKCKRAKNDTKQTSPFL